MRKVFKQIIAILLIIVLQLNSVCCINATELVASASEQDEIMSNDPPESSSSFGSMFAEKANEQMQQRKGNNYISDLVFSDNTATVNFTVKQVAELVVALYDEDNQAKMLAAGKTYVEAGTNKASVIFKQEEVPQYFVAKAFMLDCVNHNPLCESFTTEFYTKDIYNLRESTADDYDADKVIKLDGDNVNTNFAVLNEKTVTAEEGDSVNQLEDIGNGTYIITNANDEFAGLKVGDSFSYKCNDGNLILVKIAHIEINGSKVVIQEENDSDLRDFFDYIKIETDSSQGTCSVDNSNLKEGITPIDKNTEFSAQAYEDNVNWDYHFSYNLEVPVKDKNSEILFSGVVDFGISTNIDYYISWDHQYLSFKNEYTLSGTYNMSGELTMKEFPIGTISEHPLPCITVGLTPSVVVSASAQFSASLEINGTIGGAYDSDSGFENLSSFPTTKSEFKIEGKIFVGIKASPDISIISKSLCDASLGFTAGLEFSASQSVYNFGGEDVLHECNSCFAGIENGKLEVEFAVDLVKDIKNLKHTWSLGTFKIADFYYSEDYHEFRFDTTCPHICYPIKISVKGKQNQAINNATITVKNKETGNSVKIHLPEETRNFVNTDKAGTVKIYLPKGEYNINAEKGKIEDSCPVKVDDDGNTITISLNVELPTVTATPTPSPTPVPDITPEDQDVFISGTDRNITWRLTKDGTLYISGTGKMPDYGYTYESPGNYVTIPAPWEEVKDKIKKAIIEEGICSVGNNAFNECTELLNIQLPSTITSIGESAFSLCTALKNITLPNKIQTVSANQFSGCSSLEKVVLPENLTRIEFQAFIHCYNLKEINMPEKLEYIGTWAFCNCKSLESISFSKYLTEISGEAFQDCVNLKQVVFAARKGSKKYPDMYITLSLAAFSGCKSLETITLEGVESLFGSVFFDCSNLREIYFTKNKPSISDNFLSGMDNVTIYYPTGDKTWNGIKSKTFGGKNVTWKAYAPDSVLQSSEATNASSSLETEFSDGKNVDINTFSSEEDSEQNESFSADNIQSNDSEDVDTVSVPEGKTQEVESSVNYERESISNSGNYQTYTDRYPGSYCLFVAVKNKNADDILNPDNLLYIDQKTSDEKGTVSFSYTLKEAFNAPAFLVYGISAHTHSFNKWKTVNRATVFKPEIRQYICDICGMVEEREYGTKLKPILKVSSSKVTLRVKQSTTGLKVTKMADGDSVVSWKSSNPKIVKVNKRGKLAAQSQTGKATVTVKLKSGISKKIAVTVQKNPVKTTKISGLKKTLSLQVGKRYTLKPILTPFTSSEKITYSSSNRRVVSISSKGIIKGLKRGTAKITVQSGKKKFVITVRVK